MFDLSTLETPPAGFGRCGSCTYRQTGTAAICFACASVRMSPLAEPRCPICEQELVADGSCPNWVCGFPDRYFDTVFAISTLTGVLYEAIWAYKGASEQKGWAAIFGRVLVGFLDEEAIDWHDLIVASPTYVGEGGRSWDHTAAVLEAAAIEAGDRYPFDEDPRAILQMAPTRTFKKLKLRERKDEAEGPLRTALVVPDPDRVLGEHVLVYDDVFTDGFRAREVARALRVAGAASVEQVVLARQPKPADWT